jgi:flavodoxin
MNQVGIIYDSKFGNNEKLAYALSKGLQQTGFAVDILRIGEFNPKNLVEYDLICLGCPTHIARISEKMKGFFKEISSLNLYGKKGFCFGTRMESRMNVFDLNGSAKKIESRLRRKGVKIVKKAENVIVMGREGPLVKDSEEKFVEIGCELARFFQ